MLLKVFGGYPVDSREAGMGIAVEEDVFRGIPLLGSQLICEGKFSVNSITHPCRADGDPFMPILESRDTN